MLFPNCDPTTPNQPSKPKWGAKPGIDRLCAAMGSRKRQTRIKKLGLPIDVLSYISDSCTAFGGRVKRHMLCPPRAQRLNAKNASLRFFSFSQWGHHEVALPPPFEKARRDTRG